MRYRHNLSHNRLTSGDLGELIPITCVEVLPGDVFRHGISALVRMTPLAAPVFHRMEVRIHCWYVPHRLTWTYGVTNPGANTFENFITGGKDGTDAQTPPSHTMVGTGKNLEDQLGLPLVPSLKVNALPIRACNMIWNEWYRDQDLQTERVANDISVMRVNWGKDYFTTARPFSQKGPTVTIPLGDRAPVKGFGKANQTFATGPTLMYESDASSRNYDKLATVDPAQYVFAVEEDPANAGYPGVYTDLAQATGISVIDLRNASAIQRFQEYRARYGSRYTEYLSHLRVRSPDSRLQRPEYIAGSSAMVNVSEVLQTGLSGDGSTRFGVGDMYGHGISGQRMRPYQRLFPEHGYLIAMLSCRPRAKYLHNVQRHWLRQTKFDYWQKEVEHIGQQPVWRSEVWGTPGTQSRTTWGYSDRYEEYRYHPSEVCGDFRNKLNYWHLGRDFTGFPALNEAFIQCNPSKRIFQEQTEHSLWVTVEHSIRARRLVSRRAQAILR